MFSDQKHLHPRDGNGVRARRQRRPDQRFSGRTRKATFERSTRRGQGDKDV